ncbi:hypothetical protein PRZ48_005681 [Zasmidium cellare]|uniref:Uncharacterized protein n=1 Tax=Zasmidium cellare TaxID=395010 RepID=A0ABR0ELW1_ZASCE|nr:hypothetical protein PRZ48_005681 [Zasmidium cellare]
MADPPPKDPDKAKPPTSFLSLPAELRNYIYDLSGCLKILQCKVCHSTIRGDDEEISHRSCCFYSYDGYEIDCEYREKAYLWVNRHPFRGAEDCGRHIGWEKTHGMEEHLKEHVVGISQPALSKVSKQLRPEMLSLFYGEHIWMFAASAQSLIFHVSEKWLRNIGKTNAAFVKDITLVWPHASAILFDQWIKDLIGRDLKSVQCEAKVTFRSFGWDYRGHCYCETCVLPKETAKLQEPSVS